MPGLEGVVRVRELLVKETSLERKVPFFVLGRVMVIVVLGDTVSFWERFSLVSEVR